MIDIDLEEPHFIYISNYVSLIEEKDIKEKLYELSTLSER